MGWFENTASRYFCCSSPSQLKVSKMRPVDLPCSSVRTEALNEFSRHFILTHFTVICRHQLKLEFYLKSIKNNGYIRWTNTRVYGERVGSSLWRNLSKGNLKTRSFLVIHKNERSNFDESTKIVTLCIDFPNFLYRMKLHSEPNGRKGT